jgi:hypothetical protein
VIVKLGVWAIPFIPGAFVVGAGAAFLFESSAQRAWALGLSTFFGLLGVLDHARHAKLADWPEWIGSLLFGARRLDAAPMRNRSRRVRATAL